MEQQRPNLRQLAAIFAVLGLLGAALLPTSALAQAAAGGDQYNPVPPGDAGPAGGEGKGPGNDALNLSEGGANNPGASADSDGGDSLPFTGYPLSTLALIMLALLILGGTIRFGPRIYQRLREATPPSFG